MTRASRRVTRRAVTKQRIFIDIDKTHQPALIEWRDGHWVVWLAYNRDKTAGTYLVLTDDAQVLRFVQEPTGSVRDVTVVKGKN